MNELPGDLRQSDRVQIPPPLELQQPDDKSSTEQPQSPSSSTGSLATTTKSLIKRHLSVVRRKRRNLHGQPSGTGSELLKSAVSRVPTNWRRYLVIGLFGVGAFVCVASLSCFLLLPSFVANQIGRKLVLRNNSMLLERWARPNAPMFFKVWMWDVRNAADIMATPAARRGSVRPQLRELGPFVFRLRRQKDVVSFAGDNVYYTERKIYHFEPSLSCCPINTSVTLPNIPLVAVVDRALGYNLPLVGRFVPRLVNRATQSLRERLFVTRQVRELLFDGYEVDLLKMVARIGSIVGLPETNRKFAIFKGRNDTWRPDQDGVWAINSGARDRRQFGRVMSWNSYKQLPFWSQPVCNMINGSDGTLFPPPIATDKPLHIFNQELCRSVNLVYKEPSDVRAIKSLRFQLNPLNFAHTSRSPSSSGSTSGQLIKQQQQQQQSTGARLRQRSRSQSGAQSNQENNATEFVRQAIKIGHPETPANPYSCFCERKSTNLNGVNVCDFDGLIDLSRCSKQAQVIFATMPHFHQTDPRLLQQVLGLRPNASLHHTYLDIEPNTGLVLAGKRRVQLNILIKHNKEIDGFENISDMLIPLLWFEESAMIGEESASKFRSLYTNRIRMINVVLISLFVASLGLLAINLHLVAYSASRRNSRKLSLADGSTMAASKHHLVGSALSSSSGCSTGAGSLGAGTNSGPASGLASYASYSLLEGSRRSAPGSASVATCSTSSLNVPSSG